MNNSNNVNKEKLVLANRDDMQFDEAFQTKPIGYYKDAWLRFKKNKASVVAAIIMIFLIFMSVIGPFVKGDTLFFNHVTRAQRLVSQGELPPKINALSWISAFDGKRTITRSNLQTDLIPLEDPEVIERFGRILYTDLDTVRRAPDGTYTVTVDFYNYVNYRLSTPFWDRDILGMPEYRFNATGISTDELLVLLDKIKDARAAGEDPGVIVTFQRLMTTDGIVVNQPIIDVTGQVIGWQEDWEALLLGPDAVTLEPGQTHRVTVNFFTFLDMMYDVTPEYWFGADARGRDWFYMLWLGARISLLIALTVSVINILIGVVIGSISGYFGGAVDLAIERISEIIAGIPFLALITLLILRYGSSVPVVIVAFTLTGWLGIASVTRREFYRYKGREYVLAARTLGASDVRIMSRHILPNAVGTMITVFVLYIPSVIFTESTFSYLGIIDYGNVASVGRMLSDAQSRLRVDASLGFLVMFPAIFVSFLMLSFNLFGNGLRDAFNPSLRGVEE
ncbi:MAG: ABC transporter permease [Acholeplasmataceae bacterium]|nr:MAG: ABC transporter permease [Acholeplasmataceae bacterium]